MSGTVRIAAGSILIGILVLGIKWLAYMVTGSVALYSDALESFVNVVTAIAALLAVRLSEQPADHNHPYGHHKVEYFSAVLAGALIMVAALLILREAWGAIQAPRTIEAPGLGLALAGVASVINALWSWLLVSRGRKLRSPALVADGEHLISDVITSVGVVIGIALAIYTGWAILDPALAGFVALNILWSGWRVIRDSLGGLMDEAVSDQELERIRGVIAQNAEGAIEAHDVRTRNAGRVTFIDFHLVVPAQMPVSDAHDICDRIERELKETVEGSLITIHVEPENKAKHSGVVVV
ncbi:cation diffusion facilitator family transporter [Amaricoccus macauensis]|uniref:Protein p34 n=1 Tax=Amaricoccus macauensis TaxID=57001 RepID=A0A840SXE8_9RHOB|nr:cation diffusion facilitator family transporter [Amaricoccus macauensis]MBB5223781.1 cation diffusion facilitator family transporter [Amaricoccus macauensis]